MNKELKTDCDNILDYTVNRAGGVPGVVAMATDRNGNFYEGAAGVRELGGDQAMTTDSVMLMASCTKAITGVAVMQLVEEGVISLDEPAKKYAPEIGELQVLDGFDKNDDPILRPAASDITLNQLMLHTSGLCYEFFSDDLLKYRTQQEIPTILSATFDSFRDVLLHDPGASWTYGSSIEWLGIIVERLRGKNLGAVMAERIFEPLEIGNTAFTMTQEMLDKRVTIHQRNPDGQLIAAPEVMLPQPPEVELGGAGLYGTVGDYLKFIRMILNDGEGPNGRVLKAETVNAMAQNGLGKIKTSPWKSSIPSLANSGDFFPGLSKSWSYTFQVNDEPTPTGRPAGQLAWAGLANTFFWIDRLNGIGGMWGTQILPFQDAVSYPGFMEFERTVYANLPD
ncbi:MAG: serine hydrolase domain-containing protein [Gammaproteobacteria bacterium]